MGLSLPSAQPTSELATGKTSDGTSNQSFSETSEKKRVGYRQPGCWDLQEGDDGPDYRAECDQFAPPRKLHPCSEPVACSSCSQPNTDEIKYTQDYTSVDAFGKSLAAALKHCSG